jgi:hypothetical protein
MFKRLSIGFIALFAVYVFVTGDLTLVGLKYRLIAYASVVAEGLAGSGADPALPMETVGPAQPANLEAHLAAPDRALVHLASLPSEEMARREWLRLKEAFPVVLAGFALRVESVDLGAKGVFYRVLAQVDDGSHGARRVCASLRASDQYCEIVGSARRGAS